MTSEITTLWGKITGNSVSDDIKTYVIDNIADNSIYREWFKVAMYATNVIPVVNNNGGHVASSNVMAGIEGAGALIGAMVSMDSSVVDGTAAMTGLFGALSGIEGIDKVLKQPNIEGIPISSPNIVESRTADVSEQALIVQDTGQKIYRTDNCVPRLKEWQVEGYITPMLSLDNKFLVKPSLDMQAEFLDLCLRSRRPVLFKTTRNKFVMVQIINLQFTEEASYNNAIKVSVTLKEYNPFEVAFVDQEVDVATTDKNELSGAQAQGGIAS